MNICIYTGHWVKGKYTVMLVIVKKFERYRYAPTSVTIMSK